MVFVTLAKDETRAKVKNYERKFLERQPQNITSARYLPPIPTILPKSPTFSIRRPCTSTRRASAPAPVPPSKPSCLTRLRRPLLHALQLPPSPTPAAAYRLPWAAAACRLLAPQLLSLIPAADCRAPQSPLACSSSTAHPQTVRHPCAMAPVISAPRHPQAGSIVLLTN